MSDRQRLEIIGCGLAGAIPAEGAELLSLVMSLFT